MKCQPCCCTSKLPLVHRVGVHALPVAQLNSSAPVGLWSCTVPCSQGFQDGVCASVLPLTRVLYCSSSNLGLLLGCLGLSLAIAAVISNFGLFVSLPVLWKAFRGFLRGKGLGSM